MDAQGTCTSPTRPTTSSAGSTPRPGSSPPWPATSPPTRPATASADSPATAAPPPARSSNDPQGVAVDGAGDLFIADTFNNAIREVTPAGTISTVVNSAPAGGGTPPAGGESSGKAPTASKLNTPYGIAIDQSTDTLYIADSDNSKIAAVTGLAQPGNAAGPTAPARVLTPATRRRRDIHD